MCLVLKILSALVSRFLFAVHGGLTVWRVVQVTGDASYWLLIMGVALLGVEMAITIKFTRNAEWKWFSPMVFLYLSTVIPSVWFLELNLLQVNQTSNSSSNADQLFLSRIHRTMGLDKLDNENWVKALEQTMLIILVIGRWLMPKGDMSRDQLSQLLMVYVGLGADILDIFDTFKEEQVKTNQAVIIVGLSLFSWALMQFPLVLTQTSHPKVQSKDECAGTQHREASCCSSDVFSILLTVGLQDGPFLIYRLYLMIYENVLNQLMIFFTCKNILTVLLELYRVVVVLCEQNNPVRRTQMNTDPSLRHSEQGDGETVETICPE
ncbi:hypothetical protein DNTS_000059 [Danionella cerebrum]|uniref:Transmembrane protein 26 n=1 Tax=Danionella cerebrum TaxID=2873325 RepID=A0A553PXC7_9TELE|nr:hypothetical protein DNTS_000059 [Danionella translucida]